MFVRYYAPENETGGGGAEVVSNEAPVESTPREAPAEPVDMETTIRQSLKEIQGRNSTQRERDPVTKRFTKAAAPPAETEPTDETGTPAPAETGEPTEQPAVAAPEIDTNPDKIEVTDAQGNRRPVDITKPPDALRAETKAEWLKLPEAVRRDIHKRENDFHNGISQYRAAANFATQLGGEFKPYESLLRSQGHTPQALTRDFMNSHYKLSNGSNESKAAELIRVAGLYNLSVNDLQTALGAVQSGAQPPAQVQLPPEFAQFKQEFSQWKEQQAAAEQASIQEQIRKFETDPTKPHFKEVAVTMGRLLTAGEANDMAEAYDKACRLVPSVQAKLDAKRREAEQKTIADKAALAKKAASVNVAARGKHPAAAPVGSMEDTIRAAYRRINGGGAS